MADASRLANSPQAFLVARLIYDFQKPRQIHEISAKSVG
jgi:hypothetical protein